MAALALVALLGGAARAQSPRDQAKAHFAQGEAYFKAEAYDKAAEEYQAAYDLVPEPGLLFNIGLANQQGGDAARAAAAYQRYLDEAPQAAKAAEARARLETLTRELDLAAAERERALEATRQRDEAARLGVEGDHAGAIVALRAAERLSSDPEIVYELAIAYRAADDDRTARAELARYLEAAPTGGHRAEAIRQLDAIDHPLLGPRPSLLPAWISFGAAAVLGGVGIVFGRAAGALHDELAAELETGTPPLDSRDPRIERGARDRLIGNVSLIAAGIATVVGIVFVGRSLLAERPVRRVLVQPASGGAGATVLLEATW